MFAACSGGEESTSTPGSAQEQTQGAQEGGNAPQNGEQNANGEGNMQARGNGTTGLVTDVVGNEITIQVGEMEGGMGGGQMPEGATLPEGSEGMGDMTQEERAEMQNGEMPEGMTPPEGTGDRQQGANGSAQRPEGAGGEGAMGGGIQLEEGQDYSEIVTLTDETRTFSVPVTTPVVQFGTEMTFSQITEDMYITVMLDENENVTSISILG